MDTLTAVLTPIHREGHRFIALFAILTVLLFAFVADGLGWVGVGLTAWCAYFFRDPKRVTPDRDGLVVSPADGVVQMIENAVPPPELDMGPDARPRISIFMNVFNVHVNRVPASGTVTHQVYRAGKFLNAALDKASEENERNAIRMTTSDGRDIAFVQIAGLVARRIVSDVAENQTVRVGERFGLIRFGSRLDVYLDDAMAPLVAAGQTMIGGETVIADSRPGEPVHEFGEG